MILPLLAVLLGPAQAALEIAPDCPALGRPLSWDPKGAYALDADGPLSKESQAIVKELMDAELGRAEALSKGQLSKSSKDLVPAWALSQILRVRKKALVEYQTNVAQTVGQPASIPVLLYRLHVCRLAETELPPGDRRSGNQLNDRIKKDQATIGSQLRPAAQKFLGVAIGVTNVSLFWSAKDRETLQRYQDLHPKGPDVRPLIAQAYMSGMHFGPISTLYTDQATDPLEPRPQKGLEIAKDILKDKPNDPLGHYYAGVAYFKLGKTNLAVREFRAALATKKLAPLYEAAASAFLVDPVPRSLRPKVEY